LTKVSQIMSTDLVTVMASTPLTEAKALFSKHSIHHLPVVTAEGHLQGMLSQSDFLKLLETKEASVVGDLMTEGLAKLDLHDSIRTAASVLSLNRFHALPVVDGEKLVGVLTTLDLVKLLDQEQIQLSDYNS
ncbi:MAG: CBS domain-containing protein, partial [Bacteroidota bacterium]